MKSRKFLLIACVIFALAMSLGGTLAYLTDTDSDVNVMTLGNVQIEQWENGKAKGFIQGQPLYPAYYPEDTVEEADQIEGGIEKRVDVKNTGSSDAYVRTVFAFETGDLTEEQFLANIHLQWNKNETDQIDVEAALQWAKDDAGKMIPVEIKDSRYYLAWYVYPDKVAPGAQAGETLQGIIMDKNATNDIVNALGETYQIFVVSQACQTVNFESVGAARALDVAFQPLAADSHPWIDLNDPADEKDQDPDNVQIQEILYGSEIWNKYGQNGSYALGEDVVSGDMIFFGPGTDVSLNLNGKTVTATDPGQYLFAAPDNATLRFTGEGTVNAGKCFFAPSLNGVIIIDGGIYHTTQAGTLDNIKHTSLAQNNGKIIINGGTFTTDVEEAVLFFATTNAVVEVNGGFFENTADDTPDLFGIGINKYDTNRVIFRGGTFVNWNPLDDLMCYTGEWPENGEAAFAGPWMLVYDGYKVVSESQANGDIWYSVVPE